MATTTTGRLVLVTGGAGGLGRGITFGLARAGFRIAFTYRPGGTPPDETLELVREFDPDAVAIASDASRDAEGARAVRIASERGPLDVLVHVVGPIVVGSFARMTYQDYRAMVDGNLGSAVSLARAVLPAMRERGFGRLVFFGMNGSDVAMPAQGQSLYAAAKAGVTSLARTLAVEEARYGITVNVVQVGDIRDKAADQATAVTLRGK
ncbi:MAG: SDR family NAD(P)-dependent oxidoreductase, partial [Candidatus Eremiobacteraeota bacterium]|nr:SDR family NAD(P)-dependent oxidoreductase [Candidatus Eremiobacteraeota bacterium]